MLPVKTKIHGFFKSSIYNDIVFADNLSKSLVPVCFSFAETNAITKKQLVEGKGLFILEFQGS